MSDALEQSTERCRMVRVIERFLRGEIARDSAFFYVRPMRRRNAALLKRYGLARNRVLDSELVLHAPHDGFSHTPIARRARTGQIFLEASTFFKSAIGFGAARLVLEACGIKPPTDSDLDGDMIIINGQPCRSRNFIEVIPSASLMPPPPANDSEIFDPAIEALLNREPYHIDMEPHGTLRVEKSAKMKCWALGFFRKPMVLYFEDHTIYACHPGGRARQIYELIFNRLLERIGSDDRFTLGRGGRLYLRDELLKPFAPMKLGNFERDPSEPFFE